MPPAWWANAPMSSVRDQLTGRGGNIDAGTRFPGQMLSLAGRRHGAALPRAAHAPGHHRPGGAPRTRHGARRRGRQSAVAGQFGEEGGPGVGGEGEVGAVGVPGVADVDGVARDGHLRAGAAPRCRWGWTCARSTRQSWSPVGSSTHRAGASAPAPTAHRSASSRRWRGCARCVRRHRSGCGARPRTARGPVARVACGRVRWRAWRVPPRSRGVRRRWATGPGAGAAVRRAAGPGREFGVWAGATAVL